MRDRRERVVATTGTSLLTNLREVRSGAEWTTWLESQPAADRPRLAQERSTIERACRALARQDWEEVGTALAEVNGFPRLLGAEVSSLVALRAESAYAAVREVALLHSDTPEGEAASRILQALLVRRFGLAVEVRRIELLHDANPSQFKVAGLRNLIRELAQQVRQHGARRLVLDATGGYKAQVAMTVVFGQAYGIPVVYRFERFAEIIEFPPLPFVLDLSLFERVADLFEHDTITPAELAQRLGGPLTEANPHFAAAAALLASSVDASGQEVFVPSPFGQLALEMWRRRQKSHA